MSFPQIEAELKEVKVEIREMDESIKQLIIQMQLINIIFEVIVYKWYKGISSNIRNLIEIEVKET